MDEPTITAVDIRAWDKERSEAATLAGMVDDLLALRESGGTPLGGWEVFYQELHGQAARYTDALMDAPHFPDAADYFCGPDGEEE